MDIQGFARRMLVLNDDYERDLHEQVRRGDVTEADAQTRLDWRRPVIEAWHALAAV